MPTNPPTQHRVIGWREWVALPQLGIDAIKAKVDTGARTSSLHAFDLEEFMIDGVGMVRFKVHPVQRSARREVAVELPVHDYRDVKPSSGHVERRPVVVTRLDLLGRSWDVELTLTRRDAMGFRMLLGREAVRRRFLVDPARSYCNGRPNRKHHKPRNDR